MFKRIALALLQGLLLPAAFAAPPLTEVELRWLAAGRPVLAYAQQHKLPLDVVVQPQPRPGDVPLGMAFVDGRCKLVLTMRGRPPGDDPEALLRGLPEELRGPVIAAMTAHELAHCWRHVQGAWHSVPAGFDGPAAETPENETGAKLERRRRDMRDVRREEGFADLVGLSWTAARHPEHYQAVHAWFSRIRDERAVAGDHHDTREWIARVRDPRALLGGDTPFEAALPVWLEGLDAAD